jgi:hypothetical protein
MKKRKLSEGVFFIGLELEINNNNLTVILIEIGAFYVEICPAGIRGSAAKKTEQTRDGLLVYAEY